jgi:hypothetical protein
MEGHCNGLDHCVDDIEQKTEERLVSPEMVHTEVETGRAGLEKQFNRLQLEVGRLMERESLMNP